MRIPIYLFSPTQFNVSTMTVSCNKIMTWPIISSSNLVLNTQWLPDGCTTVVNETGRVTCHCDQSKYFALQTVNQLNLSQKLILKYNPQSEDTLDCGEHEKHNKGFVCDCNSGYHLDDDGKTCSGKFRALSSEKQFYCNA